MILSAQACIGHRADQCLAVPFITRKVRRSLARFPFRIFDPFPHMHTFIPSGPFFRQERSLTNHKLWGSVILGRSVSKTVLNRMCHTSSYFPSLPLIEPSKASTILCSPTPGSRSITLSCSCSARATRYASTESGFGGLPLGAGVVRLVRCLHRLSTRVNAGFRVRLFISLSPLSQVASSASRGVHSTQYRPTVLDLLK